MGDWKKCQLGMVADIQCGPFGSQLHESDYVLSGGTPIVTVEHLGNRHFTTQNLPLVSNEDKERLSRYVMSCGDVIFSRVGSVDRCSFVDQGSDGWMFSGRCIRVRPNKEIAGEYLYYYLSNPRVKQIVRDMAVGTTMPSINSSIMGDVPIEFPPLPTQHKIAAVLGALDDKIENNRKICANLEAQAQAIFKSWFVDFEPFGGKMPQGWKMGKLGELIEVCYGKDHKALPEGNIPVFGSGGYMRSVDRCIYDEESVLIPRKGTLNNIMYVNEPFWTVDTMFYSKMREEHVAKYVHLLLQGKNMEEFNVGSAVPSMTTEILNNMEIIIPLTKTLQEFDGIANSIYAEVAHAKKESRALAATRDTLLPKLMSGEIDVEKVKVA